jgi:putative AbiEii toxin of type IV toxin-antitoxin system
VSDVLFLHGLGLAGYRSFGELELQRIAPLSKVHLIAGPNNAGKSNLLRMGAAIVGGIKANHFELVGSDMPRDEEGRLIPFRGAVALDLEDELSRTFPALDLSDLRYLLTGDESGEPQPIWFEFSVGDGNKPAPSSTQIEALNSRRSTRINGRNIPQNDRISWLSGELRNQSGGNPDEEAANLLRFLIDVLRIPERLPQPEALSAFRQIVDGSDAPGGRVDHNGAGLIDRLAKLQHPPPGYDEDLRRFEGINQFVASVVDEPAAIEIPEAKDTILIRFRGGRRPLENMGTGIHQVVILAAAATTLTDSLVCIEEPEIHLHPTFQRKLLDYLANDTSNQYLITTHSAALLDTERASITGLRLEDTNTHVVAALTPDEVARISSELGFRASDIVQSSAIIWVEGPSDRIYIRHWLRLIAPAFVEGVHYSIMFYGGRLLSRLSADAPAVEEFVHLPSINRNIAVVIDSDISKAGGEINGTKQRIRDEVTGRGGVTLVTRAYTIENYIPPEILKEAVTAVHAKATCTWAGDDYTGPLSSDNIKGTPAAVDKTAIANEVIKHFANADELPEAITDDVHELVELLLRANR